MVSGPCLEVTCTFLKYADKLQQGLGTETDNNRTDAEKQAALMHWASKEVLM